MLFRLWQSVEIYRRCKACIEVNRVENELWLLYFSSKSKPWKAESTDRTRGFVFSTPGEQSTQVICPKMICVCKFLSGSPQDYKDLQFDKWKVFEAFENRLFCFSVFHFYWRIKVSSAQIPYIKKHPIKFNKLRALSYKCICACFNVVI